MLKTSDLVTFKRGITKSFFICSKVPVKPNLSDSQKLAHKPVSEGCLGGRVKQSDNRLKQVGLPKMVSDFSITVSSSPEVTVFYITRLTAILFNVF